MQTWNVHEPAFDDNVVIGTLTLAVFIVDVTLGVWLVGPDFACCVLLIAMYEPKVITTRRRLGGNSNVKKWPGVNFLRRAKRQTLKMRQTVGP